MNIFDLLSELSFLNFDFTYHHVIRFHGLILSDDLLSNLTWKYLGSFLYAKRKLSFIIIAFCKYLCDSKIFVCVKVMLLKLII